MKTILALGSVALLGLVFYAEKGGNMKYFKPREFGIWWPFMNKDLLTKLDLFREKWGKPVRISTHPDAIGRHGGSDSQSQHNVDLWGTVNAVDVFPEGMNTESARHRAYLIARSVGFTGIGIYTDTVPSNMMHLDVRSRVEAEPATWARVAGQYVGIQMVV